MKNFLYLLSITFIFNACEAPLSASSTSITDKRTCANFTAVISDLPGNIHVTCSADTNYSCQITAADNLMKLIECSIEKDELLIRFKRTARIKDAGKIDVNITMPTIKGIKVLGSGDAEIDGKLVSNNLLCAMMGSGNIKVQGATIGKLRADITGSGNILLQNSTCQKAEYALKGSGSIDATNVPADSVRAIVAGSGAINCMAIKILDAEINGSGDITYLGKPSVIRNKIGGNGKIIGDGVLTESAK
jgi:Putative auto-transporter adhesin, head GIN domain